MCCLTICGCCAGVLVKLEDFYAGSFPVAHSVQDFYLRGNYNVWCCAKVLDRCEKSQLITSDTAK